MGFQDFNIHFTGSGSEVRTTCPQCSSTRKKTNEKCLAVNTIEGIWLCHHCGWSGGIKGNDFKPIPYKVQDYLPESVIKYFEGRGIPQGILEQEHIGFENEFGKGWIKFPYYQNSICVNIKYRTSTKDFRQEKGGKKILYRFDRAMSSDKKVLIVNEGEIDTLSCLVTGFEAVSIPDGAPSENSKNFTTKFDFLKGTEKLFDRFDKIILAGDNDGPGKRAIQELGRRIGVEKCFVVEYPAGCKDANDVLVKHGKEILKSTFEKAKPFPVEGIVSPENLKDLVLHEYSSGVQGGEKTGWNSLDGFYTVRPGELTIVTGIPGSGKSNFVDALCINLIKSCEWRFGLFSPENWPLQRHIQTLTEKLINKSFRPSKHSERMTPAEVREAVEMLDDYIKFIAPKSEILSIDTILKYARILCLQFGIKGMIIDPWNEVEHCFKGLSETQYISQELTKIRRFARFNGIHIWIVAHPTKLSKNLSGKYDPPTMYDIAGGAHWRNKADNGLCIYRDFETNITEIIVQKIRFKEIGKLGSVSLKYTHSGNYKTFGGKDRNEDDSEFF
ncbi:MAG: DnaB-like helicase C-terminal domain-containing protein [Desulfobacula sp.]|jgi:twinkle protein